MNQSPPFKVWITPSCLEKINHYATEALPTEIGGFIKVTEEEDNVFVTDIFVPKQKATGGTFEIDADMDNEFMREMMKAGKREEIKNYKGMFHSHPVGMGPSMSSTDVDAIKRRAEDTECYSLIISASRKADSTDLLMHYCANVFGKKMIWRDIPVMIGWESGRIKKAKSIVDFAIKELVGDNPTDNDTKLINDNIMSLVCTDMPAYFENDSKELKVRIKEHVASVVENVGRNWSYGYDPKSYQKSKLPISTDAKQHSGNFRTLSYEEAYANTADNEFVSFNLNKMRDDIERLHSIGYNAVDPDNTDPKNYVTKTQAKKARRLHRRKLTDLNKYLREHGGGIGLGDLVTVDPSQVRNITPSDPIAYEAVEVSDFHANLGIISYEVGDEMFYGDELILCTPVEEYMGWTSDKSDKTKEQVNVLSN